MAVVQVSLSKAGWSQILSQRSLRLFHILRTVVGKWTELLVYPAGTSNASAYSSIVQILQSGTYTLAEPQLSSYVPAHARKVLMWIPLSCLPSQLDEACLFNIRGLMPGMTTLQQLPHFFMGAILQQSYHFCSQGGRAYLMHAVMPAEAESQCCAGEPRGAAAPGRAWAAALGRGRSGSGAAAALQGAGAGKPQVRDYSTSCDASTSLDGLIFAEGWCLCQ